jgi:uracil-DNA glycosylase
MAGSGHLPGSRWSDHRLTIRYDKRMTSKLLAELEDTITRCHRCPRLVAWREQVAREKRRAYKDQEYWGKPVPGFGDSAARLLIVGLAPGAHGSNRTGRMFTGDASGEFLYPALFRAGFASQPHAGQRNDGLALNDCFISAVCRCAPPDNKPAPDEIAYCLPYLKQEMGLLPNLQGIVALGSIAFNETLSLLGLKSTGLTFGHGKFYEPGDNHPWILSSYHPSRQNTQTGRLTTDMFNIIWETARGKLKRT